MEARGPQAGVCSDVAAEGRAQAGKAAATAAVVEAAAEVLAGGAVLLWESQPHQQMQEHMQGLRPGTTLCWLWTPYCKFINTVL